MSSLKSHTTVSGVYVFNGHPYEQTEALGVGILDLSKEGDGVPIHTKGLCLQYGAIALLTVAILASICMNV